MSKEKTYHVWEVELWTNVGTWENPIFEWVISKRYYHCEKSITDFDLFEIPDKRRNVTCLGWQQKTFEVVPTIKPLIEK